MTELCFARTLSPSLSAVSVKAQVCAIGLSLSRHVLIFFENLLPTVAATPVLARFIPSSFRHDPGRAKNPNQLAIQNT